MKDDKIRVVMNLLTRLPGVGERTAKRFAVHLLTNHQNALEPLARSLGELSEALTFCKTCFRAGVDEECDICRSSARDDSVICIVENLSSLWAIESGGSFRGKYHVLGGLLSAIHGIGPKELRLPQLLERCKTKGCKELILALSPNLQGQATLHYIYDSLKEYDIKITTLAQGIPVGGEIDYFDDVTISKAIIGRKSIEDVGQ